MARPCSVCSRPDRVAIDDALRNGVSIDRVVSQFDLPSRSALHRHRTAHLGRAVLIHVPATADCASPMAPEVETDGDAAVDVELCRMLSRAAHDEQPSVQQVARLAVDQLLRVVAAANLAHDRDLAVRALRELRGLMEFHARVSPDRLKQQIGWQAPPAPHDPLLHLAAWLTAPLAADPATVEADALTSLAETNADYAAALRDPAPGDGSVLL